VVLLLDGDHKVGVRELLPLQIGDTNTIIIVIIGIAFAIVVVVLVLNALRRSSAMSNELSTEWEKKFEAIKPAAMGDKTPQTVARPQPRIRPAETSRNLEGYNVLQTELRENRGRLQRTLQEITSLKEEETRIRNEILGLRTQLGALQERFSTSQDEIRRLKAQIEANALAAAKQQEEQHEPPAPPPEEPQAQVQEAPQIEVQTEVVQPTPEPQQPVQQATSETWVSRHFGSVLNRRTCPTCGSHVQSRDMYCDSCGQLLPRTI
jgi:hypothetical protein